MRSPVTRMIQDYQSLTSDEQKVFLDFVAPEPEPPAAKKTRAKRGTGNGAKSRRASGMAEAIKNSIQAGQEASANGADEAEEKAPLCGACGNVADYQDHFKPSPNYHEFDPPKSAPRAGRKSRQNTPDPQSDQSSEIEKAAALAASSGGD